MLKFEKITPASEKIGARLGFLTALLIFTSLIMLLLTRQKIIKISAKSYFFITIAISLIYLLSISAGKKKK